MSEMNDKTNINQRSLAWPSWPLLAASLIALLAVVVMLAASSSQQSLAIASASSSQHAAPMREQSSSAFLRHALPARPLVEPCGPNSNYTSILTLDITPEPVTNLVPGSQCDECTVVVGLPFATQLYDGI